MELNNFSLIYPSYEKKQDHYKGIDLPKIDDFDLEELGMLDFIDLKNSNLSEFFTNDKSVIEYRMETFKDMLDNPEISDVLSDLIPVLCDILELRRLEADSGDTNSYLTSITEIELYISCIDILNRGFKNIRHNLKSTAYISFADRIIELADSEYYKELNNKLSELTDRVREIKSVTIGVNLDAQLRPTEAGVLSINPEAFRSGDVLEKILRLNFKDDEYTCIANLVPFNKKQNENQKTALSLAFNSAINDVYKSSLHSWKKIVKAYVLDNTNFLLDLLGEFEFVVKATDAMRALMNKGCDLCVPTIMPMSDRIFKATGLYNPCVAIKIDDEIITNDLIFDENATIYVLTGPNRGGKSVITCALGIAQAMLQLGLFIPAKEAIMSPVDAIYTHFPTGAEDTIDKGRLGEECARLNEILDKITPNSLVLLDESLSSTGSYEASYIASEVLRGLSMFGTKCLFSTHLHELAGEIENINNENIPLGGAPIDTLVAGIEDGQRSFKIKRAKPDGKSYARDIAKKYGLYYDNIVKKINK